MVKKLAFLLCVALMAGPALGAVLDLRITDGDNDAEEHLSSGEMDITSTDLEFPYEDNANPSATDPQLNVLRFVVAIPKGAQITKAYLEFEQDETKGNDKPVNVLVEGQLTPDAPAITGAAKDLSSRAPWTVANVKWTVPMGLKNNDKFQSPDISAVLNEIVNQDGWVSGNALLLAIRDDPDNPSTGLRCVEAVEGEATAAPLLHIEVFIPEATDPDPADGAPGVTSPLLGWKAGDSAVAHNVYVGTSAELTAANLVAPQQPVAMYFHIPGLESGVTYYWRVDEIDAAGVVTTGAVWSFTALPVTAWAPNPADGATNTFPSSILSWSAGQGAVEHQVFLSSSQADVAAGAAAADKGKIADTKLDTGLLALGTAYYWRVDEIQGDGSAIKGPVWSFTTAEVLEIRIASGADDAEEHLNAGMDLTSSDLEIVHEDAGTPATDEQLIGMRWMVPIAKDTAIAKAYIEFELKEIKTTTNDAPVNVIIEGQLDPNPPAFTSAAKDITNRIRTKAQVPWTIPPGMAVGAKFQTPDISPILAELTSQDGWAGGNAMVIVIRDDKSNPSTGLRCVMAYNGSATAAPLLHIEPVAAPPAAPAATIIWVSFHGADDAPSAGAKGVGFTEASDKGYTDLLKANGYDVVRYVQTGTPDAAILNTADLVIISRAVASGSFQNNAATAWNTISAPMIILNGYTTRKNRTGYNTGNTIPDTTGDITLTVSNPAHPIFAGIPLTDGTTTNPFAGIALYPDGTTKARGISIVTEPVNTQGTVLATVSAAGNGPAGATVIAEWPAGATVTHDGGAGTDTLAGPRLMFLTGAREASGKSSETAGMYDLSDDGARMFLNAVRYMLP